MSPELLQHVVAKEGGLGKCEAVTISVELVVDLKFKLTYQSRR